MQDYFFILQTENGNYDVVTIYDGSNDQSTQIEKLSGNLGTFNITSTGNFLFVKFETDTFTSKKGFHAIIHYGNPTHLNGYMKTIFNKYQAYHYHSSR